MSEKRRKRHSPEQIVRKLRDADAMLNSGKDVAAVLQALEIGESTLERWRKQYGEMKSEEAVRLKKLEEENKRLKQLVADQALDIQMLRHLQEGNWRFLPGSERRSRSCNASSRRPSEGLVRPSVSRAVANVTSRSRGATSRDCFGA